jgi:hypothetical protein
LRSKFNKINGNLIKSFIAQIEAFIDCYLRFFNLIIDSIFKAIIASFITDIVGCTSDSNLRLLFLRMWSRFLVCWLVAWLDQNWVGAVGTHRPVRQGSDDVATGS